MTYIYKMHGQRHLTIFFETEWPHLVATFVNVKPLKMSAVYHLQHGHGVELVAEQNDFLATVA